MQTRHSPIPRNYVNLSTPVRLTQQRIQWSPKRNTRKRIRHSTDGTTPSGLSARRQRRCIKSILQLSDYGSTPSGSTSPQPSDDSPINSRQLFHDNGTTVRESDNHKTQHLFQQQHDFRLSKRPRSDETKEQTQQSQHRRLNPVRKRKLKQTSLPWAHTKRPKQP